MRAWTEAKNEATPPPLAILRIPSVGLEVAILEGTDDWTLNRALGHIADTPAPGAPGNSGIAGHRDGFFRSLKDVKVGDPIEVETLRGVTPTGSRRPGSWRRRTCRSSIPLRVTR